jgi:hypothetical protein
MQELYKLLLKSEKFLNWKAHRPISVPIGKRLRPADINPALTEEKHWSVKEVADAWGVSTDSVRDVLKDQDGVLIVDRPGTRAKRGYSTMRTPQSVLEGVYAKMSER